MRFDDGRPIYLQIMEHVERLVLHGELAPGARVDSVRDMARRLRVNPNTVARAFGALERRGLIAARGRQGFFVTEDVEVIRRVRMRKADGAVRRFLTEMRLLGVSDRQTRAALARAVKEAT